jgi:hypothetical protein
VAHQRTGVHRRRHAGSRGAPLRARPRDPRRKSHRRRTAVPRARRRDYKVRAPERSVHLASQNTNLELLIKGPAINLAARHTKVRRVGYPA